MVLAGSGGNEGELTPARADVVVVPRSRGSGGVATGVDWVRSLNPRVMIQSAGESEARDTAWRWDAITQGRTLHRTAWDGAAWVECVDDGSLRRGSVR
jgi:hypothetical protein